ncbi:MAG: hypothetical protein O3A31_13470, partial [Planctomycetota bacterium]|nr:hypothetical protein [Planctomycetota bacterium]
MADGPRESETPLGRALGQSPPSWSDSSREARRPIRDDSPTPQRPKWFSAVKSPYRGGAPSTVAVWLDRCGDGSAVSSL